MPSCLPCSLYLCLILCLGPAELLVSFRCPLFPCLPTGLALGTSPCLDLELSYDDLACVLDLLIYWGSLKPLLERCYSIV